jgi:hypothetical protein
MMNRRKTGKGEQGKRYNDQAFSVNEATFRKRLKAGTDPTSLGRLKPTFIEEV